MKTNDNKEVKIIKNRLSRKIGQFLRLPRNITEPQKRQHVFHLCTFVSYHVLHDKAWSSFTSPLCWHQLELVTNDVEVEDGGVLVLEEDVLVEVDDMVLVLEVLVERC